MPNILLRSKREERQLTQTEVADAIGVTVRTVGRWERDEASPTAYCVKKLCILFEATPEELGLVRLPKQTGSVPVLEESAELLVSAEQPAMLSMAVEEIAATAGEKYQRRRSVTWYRLRYIVPVLLLSLLIIFGVGAYFLFNPLIASPQQTLDTF